MLRDVADSSLIGFYLWMIVGRVRYVVFRHEGDIGKPGRHRGHHGWTGPRSPLNSLPRL